MALELAKDSAPAQARMLFEQLKAQLLDYGEFLDAAYREYLWRNEADFKWAEGEEEPLEVEEEVAFEDDEET